MTKEEREEAAKILKLEQSSWRKNLNLKVDQRLYDAYNVAIEVLQEESVLDKIRERLELEKLGYPPSAEYYKAIMKVLQIIDKERETKYTDDRK